MEDDERKEGWGRWGGQGGGGRACRYKRWLECKKRRRRKQVQMLGWGSPLSHQAHRPTHACPFPLTVTAYERHSLPPATTSLPPAQPLPPPPPQGVVQCREGV